MTRGRDLVSVVEAAYRTDLDEGGWLSNVCAEADRVVGRGLGVGAYFIDSSNPSQVRARGYSKSHLRCPLDLEAGVAVAEPLDFEAYLSKQAVGTGSGQLGERRWRSRPLFRTFHDAGAADVIGIVALDPDLKGCVLAVPTREITSLLKREVRALLQVAAHLSAGQRLRTSAPGTPSPESVGVEAVLAPDGKLLHAEGPARAQSVRNTLRHLAVEVDRARSTLRRSDPDQALEVWTALVSGRWTLLDHFDSDGRRYWLATCNEPVVAGPRALTARERQVVGYAALGRSNKLIAYQLGLSCSTVATHLAAAMAKLRVRDRSELVGLLAALAASVSSDDVP